MGNFSNNMNKDNFFWRHLGNGNTQVLWNVADQIPVRYVNNLKLKND